LATANRRGKRAPYAARVCATGPDTALAGLPRQVVPESRISPFIKNESASSTTLSHIRTP